MRIFQTYLISGRFRSMQDVIFLNLGRFRDINSRFFRYVYSSRIFHFGPGGFTNIIDRTCVCVLGGGWVSVGDLKIPMYLWFWKGDCFCCLAQKHMIGHFERPSEGAESFLINLGNKKALAPSKIFEVPCYMFCLLIKLSSRLSESWLHQ